MSYDENVLGCGNSMHPANREENERTFEDLYDDLSQEDKEILDEQFHKVNYQLNSFLPKRIKAKQLLSEIYDLEIMWVTGMGLTFDQAIELKDKKQELYKLIETF